MFFFASGAKSSFVFNYPWTICRNHRIGYPPSVSVYRCQVYGSTKAQTTRNNNSNNNINNNNNITDDGRLRNGKHYQPSIIARKRRKAHTAAAGRLFRRHREIIPNDYICVVRLYAQDDANSLCNYSIIFFRGTRTFTRTRIRPNRHLKGNIFLIIFSNLAYAMRTNINVKLIQLNRPYTMSTKNIILLSSLCNDNIIDNDTVKREPNLVVTTATTVLLL